MIIMEPLTIMWSLEKGKLFILWKWFGVGVSCVLQWLQEFYNLPTQQVKKKGVIKTMCFYI